MSRRGAFILFEGVDRCGKTTQARKLVDFLNATGKETVFMRFPDRETTIGSMINAYLTKSTELDDRAIHLLFSANRWEKSKIILETLAAGKHIVCDRYAFSGVAFSSAKPGLDIEWCKAGDEGLPAPDCLLFMDLNATIAASRGGFGVERYETSDFQTLVRSRFDELRASVGGGVGDGGHAGASVVNNSSVASSSSSSSSAAGGGARGGAFRWHQVDASGTIEDVHSRILAVTEPILATVGGGAEGKPSLPILRLWDGAPLLDS